MRVESPLADIDFSIGSLRREGDRLIFTSDASSSLEAKVYMTSGDAAKLIAAFFKSPSAIGFVLSLPFLWVGGKGKDHGSQDGGDSHPFTRLNNPWKK